MLTIKGRLSKWAKVTAFRHPALDADDLLAATFLAFEQGTTLSEANFPAPVEVEKKFAALSAKLKGADTSLTMETATGAALRSAMARVAEYQKLIDEETRLEDKLVEVRAKLEKYKVIAAAMQRVIDAERELKNGGGV